jgi:hypothetical protein
VHALRPSLGAYTGRAAAPSRPASKREQQEQGQAAASQVGQPMGVRVTCSGEGGRGQATGVSSMAGLGFRAMMLVLLLLNFELFIDVFIHSAVRL